MIWRFLIYGLVGWVLEIIWTGLHSFLKKDFSLISHTSLWMFPIYGLAVFLEPICSAMAGFPLVIRGGVYMCCIFLAEYITGWGLQKTVGVCPWDYSDSRFQVNGLIRLDYAPAWFVVGLLFEKLYMIMV